jgi:hypothetical protein
VDVCSNLNVHHGIDKPSQDSQADAEPDLFISFEKFHTSKFLIFDAVTISGDATFSSQR